MNEKNRHTDIDELLNGILKTDSISAYYPLNDLFEQRIKHLGITKNQALNILEIDHKTLASFLIGDSKKIDFVTILKFSSFLDISPNVITDKYFQIISNTQNEGLTVVKKRSYIVNNFNLPSLKKIGFIDNITDYDHIEKKINSFFGYENIFEHSKHRINAAFSSAKRATNKENLTFWYAAACESLEKTPNPNEFDRQGLIEYFPQIRWHSMNVENGLLLVAQALFKLGITIIIVPKFTQDIHVRGATIPHNDKPAIALTKYTHFYATMWFALIHELFHVLYDWEEIKNDGFHISGETTSIKISEMEADNFSRQYLFSDEKMKIVKPHINEPRFVKAFAEQNHVHPSLIYNFYSWDADENTYSKYNKQMTIDFNKVLEQFKTFDFLEFTSVKEITKNRNLSIFN